MLRPTITVTVRRTTQNRTGGIVDAGSFALSGCVWWPGGSSEEFDRRDEVTTQSTLSVPAGSDVRPTDEIVLPDNTVWQVNGQPQPYTGTVNSGGRGTLVSLQRGTG